MSDRQLGAELGKPVPRKAGVAFIELRAT